MKLRLVLSLLMVSTVGLFSTDTVLAQGLTALEVTNNGEGGQTYSLSLQMLFLMTAMTMLPSAVLTMSSFTRIIVVLAILRQALGTQSTPSNQILLGLALFLSLFVMAPVAERMYDNGIQPYIEDQISEEKALVATMEPLKQFMLEQTREIDIAVFADIAGTGSIESPEDTPLAILIPAFVTSELKTAFEIGFLVFIPFVVIDLVVASVLMSMGMMMLSPMIISMPFKIMLFVLVDGWTLIVSTLASSFYGVVQ